MKFLWIIPVLLSVILVSGMSTVYAENALENESLFVESSSMSLDLKFGEDEIRYGLSKTITTSTVDEVTLKLYVDEIAMSDPQVKVSGSGEHFRVSSIPDGVMMFGHLDDATSNYNIKLYIAGSTFEATATSYKPVQSEIIEPTNNVVTNTGVELNILTDQTERVYNKTDYLFFVKTFDSSVYPGNDFQKFDGKVSGAKVSAIIIDPDGDIKSDVNGLVEHGIFEGSVYVPENLWQRGWYTVDIVVESEGKFYQEQLSFYVYGQAPPSGSNSSP